MSKIIYFLDLLREEGRREKAKNYLQIRVGLLLNSRKNAGLEVKVSVSEKKSSTT